MKILRGGESPYLVPSRRDACKLVWPQLTHTYDLTIIVNSNSLNRHRYCNFVVSISSFSRFLKNILLFINILITSIYFEL